MTTVKKHCVTLSGMPGSGKSSTAKKLAGELSYSHFSSGDLLRSLAQERGMSIEVISELARHDRSIDPIIDGRIREIGQEKDNIIIDSRIAFHWIPNSFKVFLKIDPSIAAQRMYRQITREGRLSQTASSLDDVYDKLLKRLEAEKDRYERYYNIDYTDESQYDLVIDSGLCELDERVSMIVDDYKEWLQN